MLDFLQTPTAKVVLMLAVLVVLVIVGVYVVLRFRGFNDDDVAEPQDVLTNFRELHERGDISDAEYRQLKTALSKQTQDALSDEGETD